MISVASLVRHFHSLDSIMYAIFTKGVPNKKFKNNNNKKMWPDKILS